MGTDNASARENNVEVVRLTQQLHQDIKLDRGYLALLIGSTLMAAIGLEQNSTATIIGAMVVAPLMLPIRRRQNECGKSRARFHAHGRGVFIVHVAHPAASRAESTSRV